MRVLELVVELGLLILFAASTGLGSAVKSRIPEDHRSKDALELIQLVMSLLITFTAVVLGLLITSVKTTYDTAVHDRAQYASELTQLDRCMRNYGPGADPVRLQLQRYTAAVLASTWPDEPQPIGIDYPDVSHMARSGPDPVLARMMNGIGVAIRQLGDADTSRRGWADVCYDIYKDTLRSRSDILEDLDLGMSMPFYCMVVFWLTIVFAGFGLRAPTNRTVVIVLGLGIVAVTSALTLIIDLDQPYEGWFHIPSDAMRTALSRMAN